MRFHVVQIRRKRFKKAKYFPIRIGDVHTYAIDTVIFDLFQKKIDTISHIVREEVVERFVDASDDTVYRIELSTYNPLRFEWEVFKSFERKIVDNYALEDGKQYRSKNAIPYRFL
ncbi:MAG: hypothetical protein R2852_06560 [Bacteroidia bacterium]